MRDTTLAILVGIILVAGGCGFWIGVSAAVNAIASMVN